MNWTRFGWQGVLAFGLLLSLGSERAHGEAPHYAVVVARATHDDPAWREVADTLVRKHGGRLVIYANDVRSVVEQLREPWSDYVCFLARPEEVSRSFVAEIHQLTRQLDDDPYTDAIWGILTGWDADNAIQIARETEPLVIRHVVAGTEIALDMCEAGVWYSELQSRQMVRKLPGQDPQTEQGPTDTTQTLVQAINEGRAQLFVTSGHATERDWQIGFSYPNGSFRSQGGRLFGVDLQQKQYPVHSMGPNVYLPVGNCLMGHIDGPDAMALAFLRSAGMRQMVGYTVPTWFGYGGWGLLDYFLEQPGRWTLAEAFYANQQALLYALEDENLPAGQRRGLEFDRDVVAFYGDPAWPARMAPGPCAWQQTLSVEGDRYVFEILPQRGQASFDPISLNGSQRGKRPFFQRLPQRIRLLEVVEGQSLRPTITDNFLLLPHPGTCDPQKSYRVVFRAEVKRSN